MHAKIESLEYTLEHLKVENRKLGNKHEKNCEELKSSKINNEELSKELKTASVALKSAKKELKEEVIRHEKEAIQHIDEIKNLKEFKRQKCLEERELKKRQKKLNKKLKNVMNSDVKVVEVLEKEIKSVVVDENENEEVSGDDQFKVSEPTIPVTNLFGALEEAKPILPQKGEACALGFKNGDGGGTDDDVAKDDVNNC